MRNIQICVALIGIGMVFSSLLEAEIQTIHAQSWGYRTISSGSAKGTSSSSAESDGELVVQSFRFRHLAAATSVISDSGNLGFNPKPLDISEVEVAIDGGILNYPNPFSLKNNGTTIGYTLNKSDNTELYIYDMLGHVVCHQTFSAGTVGAMQGPNRVAITSSTFGGDVLSTGVYFYYLVSNGRILGKGKMAVHA